MTALRHLTTFTIALWTELRPILHDHWLKQEMEPLTTKEFRAFIDEFEGTIKLNMLKQMRERYVNITDVREWTHIELDLGPH